MSLSSFQRILKGLRTLIATLHAHFLHAPLATLGEVGLKVKTSRFMFTALCIFIHQLLVYGDGISSQTFHLHMRKMQIDKK